MTTFTKSFLILIAVGAAVMLPPLPTHASLQSGITAAIIYGRLQGMTSLKFSTILFNIAVFFQNMAGPLALVALAIGSIMYMYPSGDEKKTNQGKKVIVFALTGVFFAYASVAILYALALWLGLKPTGVFIPNITLFGIINNAIDFLYKLLAIIATLAIIIGGFMYITAGGDEQKTKRAKQTVFTAIAGLFIAGTAGIMVWSIKQIINAKKPNAYPLGHLLFKLIAYALEFTAIIAVATFIYGGYTYLTSGGNDDQLKRGKKIIIYAIVGTAIIMLSAAIVNAVLEI